MSTGFAAKRKRNYYGKKPSSFGTKNFISDSKIMYWIKKEARDAKPRIKECAKNDVRDKEQGIRDLKKNSKKLGWLFTVKNISKTSGELDVERNFLKLYFVDNNGEMFATDFQMNPYFFVKANKSGEELESVLKKRFEDLIFKTEVVEKVDLDLNNHLSGIKQIYTKLVFKNQRYHNYVRDAINKQIKSRNRFKKYSFYEEKEDSTLKITEMREHDVNYEQRVLIDNDLRVGCWYDVVVGNEGALEVEKKSNKLDRPELNIFAFDIETTKAPLHFPDSKIDRIMMISVMINGDGVLIVNREIVSENIEDFEYTPKSHLPGKFKIYNSKSEITLLETFFELIKHSNPHIFVTFNGDFFDWPFIEDRSKYHGFDLWNEIGVKSLKKEYICRNALNLDVFCWVKRDSYLPIGSQGLKNVTKEKLGYNPEELDPELMVEYAKSKPHVLAAYSVSDAVATYYIYIQYVHSFILSLCTIVPLPAQQVLGRGTGTLCEALLMAKASKANIISPQKKTSKAFEQFFKSRLLDSETYVGGHVECIESGVFRDDIPMQFKIEKEAVEALIRISPDVVQFAAQQEFKMPLLEFENLELVTKQIVNKLKRLCEKEVITKNPLIYHFDVASMYPNIILTNRLQPVSVVTAADCAWCDFNVPESKCKKMLRWKWRGKVFPLTKNEYYMVKAQLNAEDLPKMYRKKGMKRASDLPEDKRQEMLIKRVKEYCQKVYKRTSIEEEQIKEDCICQRENPFYVDTVCAFRDRRYTYKNLSKKWRNKHLNEKKGSDKWKRARELMIVYDSMQLAHKCILNSFYGYVMRRGSRWYSMPMAAITTFIGAEIIKMAREKVEKFGRPLELDTDGIWCCLPDSFPTDYDLKTKDGKSKRFSFFCSTLNLLTHRNFSNANYQTLKSPNSLEYHIRNECSIFFEADGPYKCMMLPASPIEGKTLKKRYAVYDKNGRLAELKGFEIKRRGELKMVKIYQKEVFSSFLKGTSLEEIYNNAAVCSNYWLDLIDREGVDLRDDEIFEYFTESKSMSRNIEDYEKERSTSLTCARRLKEFLGNTVQDGPKLSLKFIISRFPLSASVSDRVIPTVVFLAKEKVKKTFLKRWCSESSLLDFDVRNIIDWDYYRERIGACIRKIVTVPAALQNLENPVPRVEHPSWLQKRQFQKIDPFNQSSIKSFFKDTDINIEDIGVTLVGKHKNPIKTQIKKLDIFSKPDENRKKETKKRDLSLKINQFFKENRSEVQSNVWQIVQIEKTLNAGVFKFWVYTSSSNLINFEVKVRRKFLLNLYGPTKDIIEYKAVRKIEKKKVKIHKSDKHLLRRKRSNYLYEITLDQKSFEATKLLFLREKTLPANEGVYESQTPPLFRAVTKLGFIARLQRRTGLADLKLDDITSVADRFSNQNYLSDVMFEKVFLYQSQHGKRSFYALFNHCGDSVDINFIVQTPNKNSDFKNLSLEKIVKKFIPKSKTTNYSTTTGQKALKIAQKIASAIKGNKFVYLQTQDEGKKIFASLLTRFPHFPIPFHQGDKTYPAFNWEIELVKTALRRGQVLAEWWDKQIDFARYLRLPVGNVFSIGNDGPLILDIIFARALKASGVSLWASKSDRPDLGGFEDEESVFIEEEDVFRVVYPGYYRTFCIEIEISILAVCAILESDRIEELEMDRSLLKRVVVSGKEGLEKIKDRRQFGKNSGFRRSFSNFETNRCSNQFEVLKQVVRKLFNDIAVSRSEFADFILVEFYRWLRNPQSLLFDPALYRYVNFLMKKFCHFLLQKLKKLGAKVIFADFSKIILCTDKTHQDSALAYIEHLIKTVKTNKLFSLVGLNQSKVWESLLFLNINNYAGVAFDKKKDDDYEGKKISEESNAISIEKSKLKITPNWNITKILPQEAEKCFQIATTMFVVKTMEKQKALLSLAKNEAAQAMENFSRELIKNEITTLMFGVVPDLIRKLPTGLDAEGVFWDQSSYITLQNYNPSLELVKATCHVLALDESVETEALCLKRGLLKLLSTTAFSREAEFRDQRLSLELCNLMCDYCNECHDLDLCRSQEATSRKWECHVCSSVFAEAKIEDTVLAKLNEELVAFLAQDYRCGSCGEPRRGVLSAYCECSERFSRIRTLGSFLNRFWEHL